MYLAKVLVAFRTKEMTTPNMQFNSYLGFDTIPIGPRHWGAQLTSRTARELASNRLLIEDYQSKNGRPS